MDVVAPGARCEMSIGRTMMLGEEDMANWHKTSEQREPHQENSCLFKNITQGLQISLFYQASISVYRA